MNGLDAFLDLFQSLLHPTALAELGVLALCLGLAWLVLRLTRPAGEPGILFGERGFDGVLFPLLALALAQGARMVALSHKLPLAVFHVAVPMLASLAVIRIAVRVLHAAFPKSPLVRALERTISWGVWAVLVLWITGLLPVLLAEMEGVSWKIGGAPVTLRSLVEGALTAAAVLVAVLWLSASIESRLMRATGVNLSVRKIAANATRAGLLLVGLLLAMSAAGIPLGALGVLGGAVGVGIGLGLQKLAANYVSGFVILAERSLRIGDVVRVDNFEGRITDISTRYTVIRANNGREAIVPNEMMITQRVENCSFADPKVALTTTVQVAYGSDVEALMPELVRAMAAVARVLHDPMPSVQLSSFAADGLELTLVFWVADIENGQGNVRSDVNLAVLRALDAQGVEIPFPQRVVRALPAGPAAGVAAAPPLNG
ncbi:mechanosensitive ion channel family protein [Aquabacterium sp. OR-4]|uniref:mechanosensitive ion channel family protein n=1 Tax=Aquabacterium sp. OR-4 TaxID=2978127 RepID=UPI0021B164FA|nr:mechanosensitive ion channel domain-containing protein [Aquabacterium sp. OR-4]MDT7836769.1 mechanosensitive ion channel [Aquabacterium sp. OR-4]